MIIYKVTNIINGKIYIGQTTNTLEYRKSQHEREAFSVNRPSVYFHNALIKYGIENFEWEVIEYCSNTQELDEMEIYYIQLYRSNNKKYGYNLKSGGKGGGICNDVAKSNMGASTKKKWQNPETASRMKEGLRKGAETMKRLGEMNYEIRVCPVCNQRFKCKSWERKEYCSHRCADTANYRAFCKASAIAAHKIREQYKAELPNKLDKIKEWVVENKHLLNNVQFNNLFFLSDLAKYLGVKDVRTVAKMLGLRYRKELARKLIEISENIC